MAEAVEFFTLIILFAPFFILCRERTGPVRLEVRHEHLVADKLIYLFLRQGGFSVGEGVPLPRPRIQVVHGTVPQKCARNTLPARSGILCRPALGELRCRPLPTSSARAPEATPN